MDDGRSRERQDEARRLMRALSDGDPLLLTETGEIREQTLDERIQQYRFRSIRERDLFENLILARVAQLQTGETAALERAFEALHELFQAESPAAD
jgi:hypothetical protein